MVLLNCSKVLADSQIYSSSHSVLPHLNQYLMLLCLVIASLSFGNINRLFKVFPPLNAPGHHICYRWFCSFHTDPMNKVPQWHFFPVWLVLFFLGFFCFLFFYLLVFVILYQWPNIHNGPLEDVSVLFLASWSEHTALSLCVRVLITLSL